MNVQEAWEAVEKYLPDGWRLIEVSQVEHESDGGGLWYHGSDYPWIATAAKVSEFEPVHISYDAEGPTPAAALRALAVKLRDLPTMD
jgi:hypothetical protein